jgi:hypothetical protein
VDRNRQRHFFPTVGSYVYTEAVAGGGFVAFFTEGEQINTFGHGVTRLEAIHDLNMRLKPKATVP